MKHFDDIESSVGRDTGFKVPEGYFEGLMDKLESKLPPFQAPQPVPKPSAWRRISPYVYMAAMFMGIWCMMKMFHTMTQTPGASLDSPPEAVAMMIDEGEGGDLALLSPWKSDLDEYSEEMEIISGYHDPDDLRTALEETFGTL